MTKFIAIALILAGLFMWRYPARSAFNRRNQYGVEIFKSYGQMRGRKSFEGLVRLCGAFLILGGIGQFIVPAQFSLLSIAHPGSQVATPDTASLEAPIRHHRH